MSAREFLVSPRARQDLAEIYQYGTNTWGGSQSSAYLSEIKEQLWRLTEYPSLGADRCRLLPHSRSIRVQSHIIFYRLDGSRIEVLRVLHKRQDPERHLE